MESKRKQGRNQDKERICFPRDELQDIFDRLCDLEKKKVDYNEDQLVMAHQLITEMKKEAKKILTILTGKMF